jgi:site-specific recombinase XerD
MYESLLPARARPAYRLSRHAKLMDARAGTLLARGYLPTTVAKHLTEWVDFARHHEADADLPADVRDPAVAAYLDRRCRRRKEGHRHVRAALHLFLGGEEWVRRLRPPRAPTSLLYDGNVPTYLAFTKQHRGRRSTRGVECLLRQFFAWLAASGVKDLAALSATHLRDYLASLGHLKRSTVAEHASGLRCFLRYLAMQGVVPPGIALSVEAPRLYRMSEPPSVLDEETVKILVDAADRSTATGKRDYAILLLAARYGMRPCDIRGLRLDDVHWRQRRIVLVQSKTQRPLELPLLDDVDDALVDYLRHGRPACDVRDIFVRHNVPIQPLSRFNNLWDVMQRAFRAAGLTPPKGRRGLYLLRHSAATRMLGHGASFDTISDVLGHASVETTRIYAQVDLAALRTVALSAAEVRP